MTQKTVEIKFPNDRQYIELDVAFKEDPDYPFGIEIIKIAIERDDVSEYFTDNSIEEITKLAAKKAGLL